MAVYEAPLDVADAERRQAELRSRLDLSDSLLALPNSVVGLDVSYEIGTQRLVAAAVVMDLRKLEVVETAIAHGEATFPYVPGLLAFREAPILVKALERLTARPEMLVCDGYGIAHPKRFGLACHMGVLTGLPSFGVAKSPFTSTFVPPGVRRGDWSPLVDGDEILGRVVRTQSGVKPVFVSVGHRMNLDQATDLTLRLSHRYRIPEAIRKADFLSREALRTGTGFP
jgi:deoxyribonuclease V